jgi:hypothetical protein
MYQWYVSTYVVSYVKLVANSNTTKPQCTGPVHAILVGASTSTNISSMVFLVPKPKNKLSTNVFIFKHPIELFDRAGLHNIQDRRLFHIEVGFHNNLSCAAP